MKNPNPAPLTRRLRCSEGDRLVNVSRQRADACGEISDEDLVKGDLQGHVLALAAKLDVSVVQENGRLGELQSAYRSSIRSLRIPWSVGEYTYFTALHELGHAALAIEGPQTHEQVLEEECSAWAWAFGCSVIKPSAELIHYSESLLDQYRHQYFCQECGRIEMVTYEDDPAFYEEYVRLLFG